MLQPTIEMLWAMKAYEHAEIYFNVGDIILGSLSLQKVLEYSLYFLKQHVEITK